MLFPTIEFTLFALLTLTVWNSVSENKNKLFLLVLFNTIFYSYSNSGLVLYLFGWSFLLWFVGKNLNYKTFFISVAISQLAFWKAVEAGFIEFHAIGTPLGISFFTFQGLTYLFARMGLPKTKPEQHIAQPWSLAQVFAFTGFFPTVFSGPILRARHWEESFKAPFIMTAKTFNLALTFIALGSFYKLCLSSIFHDYVSLAFANPKDEAWINLVIGFYAYGFEIFHDFAGYSLMAIGVALLYGFQIPDNFKQPYLSVNIREFWQKWHISFSTWLRDYFYISLGGSRVTTSRHLINTMIVMTVCGAWHGLTGNYLVWGVMHGLAVCLFHVTKDKIVLPKIVSWFITFHFVFLAWIFFRSPDIQTGMDYITNLLSFNYQDTILDGKTLGIFALFIFCLFMQKIEPLIFNNKLAQCGIFFTTVFWSSIFILILVLSPSGMPPFIYFSY